MHHSGPMRTHGYARLSPPWAAVEQPLDGAGARTRRGDLGILDPQRAANGLRRMSLERTWPSCLPENTQLRCVGSDRSAPSGPISNT